MDFTAGLMPLDTALAQMLDRINAAERDGKLYRCCRPSRV